MTNESKTLSNIGRSERQKFPYPKRVFFIIGNEFCERFNYYGMKGTLLSYVNHSKRDISLILLNLFSHQPFWHFIWSISWTTRKMMQPLYSMVSRWWCVSCAFSVAFSPTPGWESSKRFFTFRFSIRLEAHFFQLAQYQPWTFHRISTCSLV